jgi:acid phosphatase (class A)
MKILKWIPLLSLALVCAAPSFATEPERAAAPNWASVVGLYPQPGTVTGQGEQLVLLWLQKSRTPQDVARAKGEGHPSLGCFATDIRQSIAIVDFPKTEAVLEQARQDLAPVLDALHVTFARPRPYLAIPALTPVLPEVNSFSYPSTNAALGTLFAEIIRQWDPADQDALAARGNLLGTDRVLGGVHYPSDVDAGQRLGKAFATYWIDQPEHLALIQTACSEWNQ